MFHRGAGSVGYWREWPGEWLCPIILKLNHRGRGSDATHKLGSWTCCLQTHRGGGHCRWPVTQAAVGVSPSASPFGHALLPVSQLARVYHLLISFIHSPSPHPLISFCRYKVLVFDVITIPYQCLDLVYDVTLKFLRVYFKTYGRAFYVFSGFQISIFLQPWDWDLYLDLCIICALNNLTFILFFVTYVTEGSPCRKKELNRGLSLPGKGI